jgi:hypothetical protein
MSMNGDDTYLPLREDDFYGVILSFSLAFFKLLTFMINFPHCSICFVTKLIDFCPTIPQPCFFVYCVLSV